MDIMGSITSRLSLSSAKTCTVQDKYLRYVFGVGFLLFMLETAVGLTARLPIQCNMLALLCAAEVCIVSQFLLLLVEDGVCLCSMAQQWRWAREAICWTARRSDSIMFTRLPLFVGAGDLTHFLLYIVSEYFVCDLAGEGDVWHLGALEAAAACGLDFIVLARLPLFVGAGDLSHFLLYIVSEYFVCDLAGEEIAQDLYSGGVAAAGGSAYAYSVPVDNDQESTIGVHFISLFTLLCSGVSCAFGKLQDGVCGGVCASSCGGLFRRRREQAYYKKLTGPGGYVDAMVLLGV